MRPWEEKWRVVIAENIHPAYCEEIVDDHDYSVVKTDDGVYPPSIAQAHLIAAAPEMYQALEACLLALNTYRSSADAMALVGPRVQAAMRKARGETSDAPR